MTSAVRGIVGASAAAELEAATPTARAGAAGTTKALHDATSARTRAARRAIARRRRETNKIEGQEIMPDHAAKGPNCTWRAGRGPCQDGETNAHSVPRAHTRGRPYLRPYTWRTCSSRAPPPPRARAGCPRLPGTRHARGGGADRPTRPPRPRRVRDLPRAGPPPRPAAGRPGVRACVRPTEPPSAARPFGVAASLRPVAREVGGVIGGPERSTSTEENINQSCVWSTSSRLVRGERLLSFMTARRARRGASPASRPPPRR